MEAGAGQRRSTENGGPGAWIGPVTRKPLTRDTGFSERYMHLDLVLRTLSTSYRSSG